MLLELFKWLAQDIRAFNVFNYLTLRAVMATMTSLLIGWIAGPAMIRRLTTLKIGQSVRSDGPQSHLVKSGTPTMGGALILISIGLSTLLWMDLSNRFVWIVLIVTLGFGWVGWVDDYRKVVHRNPKGLSAKAKFFWQSLIGLVASVYLAFSISAVSNQQAFELFFTWVQSGFTVDLTQRADLIVPFFKSVAYPLGVWGFITLSFFVIVGTSNAVNLTDGLDGLAIMPVVMVGSALGVFAYVVGNSFYSKYLLFPHIPGAGPAGGVWLYVCCSQARLFLGMFAHVARACHGQVAGQGPRGNPTICVCKQKIILHVGAKRLVGWAAPALVK